MINYGLNHLWPTNILLAKISNEDLLNETSQEILRNFNLNEPPSDFGDYNIINDGGPVIEKFRDNVVVPLFEQYLLSTFKRNLNDYKFNLKSWLAGPSNGYSIPIHNHSGAAISAVFYLLCEEKSKGGELILADPRTNANRGYLLDFKEPFDNETFRPSTGDAILFPSFVYHHTNVFTGNLRLAMPVDLFLSNK